VNYSAPQLTSPVDLTWRPSLLETSIGLTDRGTGKRHFYSIPDESQGCQDFCGLRGAILQTYPYRLRVVPARETLLIAPNQMLGMTLMVGQKSHAASRANCRKRQMQSRGGAAHSRRKWNPPSILNRSPVLKGKYPSTMAATARATSSGCPQRRIGVNPPAINSSYRS